MDKLHFKMKTLKSALTILTPNCFFGCIDLKQAYFSVPVSVESQGWLVFWWHGQYFAFTVLANGLSSAPRDYTKIMKPIFSSLRREHGGSAVECLTQDRRAVGSSLTGVTA